MSSAVALSHHVLLFLLVFMLSVSRGATVVHVQEAAPGPAASDDGSWVMKPAAMTAAPGLGALVLNETRRRLGSFQICALCTCCGGPRGLCLPYPCCYAINCNIPNRPFGFCSFTPRSCNCFGCHL